MKYKFPTIIPAVFDRLYCKVYKWWCRFRSPFLCWLWGVKTGHGVCFQGKTFLRTHGHEIEIGDGVIFNSMSRENLVGLMSPTILDCRAGGRIKIGDYCGFSSVVIHSRSSVYIGNHVLCGGNVRIFDHDFHSLEPEFRGTEQDMAHVRTRPIVIEDGVFVGTNAIILKGTHLGPRAIVAAGSVVFGLDVPADSMVKGNPACICGQK